MIVIALTVVGCDPGTVSVVSPGGGAEVERAPIVVRTTVDPADRALADSLGWIGGVPRVSVHVLRNGTAAWLTGETDSNGTAVFEGLLPGYYRVYGERVLDPAEAERAGGVIRAFGDGRTVTPGQREVDLVLVADDPGSIVISCDDATNPPCCICVI